MADREKLVGALQVVVNLTRCIAIKRALTAVDPDPALNFWRVLHGNLLDMAVLEWCKLFGSDDEAHQQAHWKNLIEEDAFRAGLFKQVGMGEEAWRAYWAQLKAYRDQHVAHLDFNRRDVMHHPDLGPALSSSSYYYDQLLRELRSLGEERFPSSLSGYYEDFLAQSDEIARTATASTAAFEERVG